MVALLALGVVAPVQMLVGGGSTAPATARRFVDLCGGPEARIVVLALTREDPAAKGPDTVALLKEVGATNVALFAAKEPTDADREALLEEVRGAAGVYVPGGDQTLPVRRLGFEFVRNRLAPLLRTRAYFGTSAGAMLASDPMIEGPGTGRDTVQIGPGFGLVPFTVDTHVRQRRREARLAYAVRFTRAQPLALSEGEWAVVRGGKIVERSEPGGDRGVSVTE